MKQYQLSEEHGNLADFGITRRNVLKAVGVTAVAGGAFAGSAAAYHNEQNPCPEYVEIMEANPGCTDYNHIDVEDGTLSIDEDGVSLSLDPDDPSAVLISGDGVRAIALKSARNCYVFENPGDRVSTESGQDVSHVHVLICEAEPGCECPEGLDGVKFEFEDGAFLAEDGSTPEEYGLTLEVVGDPTDPKEVRVLSTQEDCEFDLVASVKAGNADEKQDVTTGGSIYGIEITNPRGKSVVNAISHVTFECK
ncbi:hypothetical protein [Halalkalicoccus sp. NIPERK01]|uniref:hypothetical protein n=1 Tax=Halalkalicoccus sp. NIPERK01 TaxID=3053469 RepID=UPI00256F597A|nr:hypothetical protein [Halalkalicoccus sp. NIPERK01]MDL5362096.1 hypothetical protein [Halalkalicoccus sp. NIPERK01]